MVGKFLLYISREIPGLHEAALLIGLSGALAKILALFRDRLLAGTFGAGETLDIYFAAFRVPDFLYAASLILSTSAAVLPVFMQKEQEGHEAVKKFISRISSAFIVILVLTISATFLLMPRIASLVAPGFSVEGLEQLVSLSRILLLSPLLLGFSTLVSNVLQAHSRFFIYALSPVLYNAGIIIGILFFYPAMGLSGLAWGVILGAGLHFLVQAPSIFSLGLFPRPSLRMFDRDTFSVLKLSLPRSLGLGINQLVLLVLTAVASAIGAGSIAIFQLAYNLSGIPLGLVGLSYSVAAFPAMTRNFVDGKKDEFTRNVVSAMRHIIFWSLPFVVLFIVLRAHVVRIILGAGLFSWSDTRLTAAALGLFSISILSQGVILLLVRAFFAAGRSIFPLIVNALSGLLTIALALGALYIFETNSSLRFFEETLLRVEGLEQASILMLVLAFSIGSVINAALLWLGFKKIFGFLDGRLAHSVIQHILASIILGLSAYFVLQIGAQFLSLQTFAGVLLHGGIAAVVGLCFSLGFLRLVKNQELSEIIAAIKQKFWKEG